MEAFLVIIAILTLIYSTFTLIEFYVGFNSLKNLSNQRLAPGLRYHRYPSFFSALNEEQDIEDMLTNLLQMDYPNFEIIAINDRSSDNTARILNALKRQISPGCRVLHIDTLPAGGWEESRVISGSRPAKGEWLLFTDADVMMKRDTLTRAMSYCVERRSISHHLWVAYSPYFLAESFLSC